MKRPLKIRTRVDQNSNHFQTLGLRRGECRIEVIRQAASQRARDFSGRAHPATVDLHRAEVAVATYRLLDPRRRTQLYERIQLSCPLELVDNPPPTVAPRSNINRAIAIRTSSSAQVGDSVEADSAGAASASTGPSGCCQVSMMGGKILERAIGNCRCAGPGSETQETNRAEDNSASDSPEGESTAPTCQRSDRMGCPAKADSLSV